MAFVSHFVDGYLSRSAAVTREMVKQMRARNRGVKPEEHVFTAWTLTTASTVDVTTTTTTTARPPETTMTALYNISFSVGHILSAETTSAGGGRDGLVDTIDSDDMRRDDTTEAVTAMTVISSEPTADFNTDKEEQASHESATAATMFRGIDEKVVGEGDVARLPSDDVTDVDVPVTSVPGGVLTSTSGPDVQPAIEAGRAREVAPKVGGGEGEVVGPLMKSEVDTVGDTADGYLDPNQLLGLVITIVSAVGALHIVISCMYLLQRRDRTR